MNKPPYLDKRGDNPVRLKSADAIQSVLGELGRRLEAHRVRLVALNASGATWEVRWTQPGAQPDLSSDDSHPLSALHPRWLEVLQQDGVIRQSARGHGTLSALVVAVWTEGKLWGFIEVASSSTRRRRAADELAARQYAACVGSLLEQVHKGIYLDSLLENATAFYVVRTDLNGRVTYASPSYRRSLGPSVELLGSSALEAVLPEDRDRCVEAVQQALAEPGRAVWAELRKIGPSGRPQPTAWEFIAVRGLDGKVHELQCVGYDLSHQRRWDLFRQEMLGLYRLLIGKGLGEATYSQILRAALRAIPAAQAGSITRLMPDGSFAFVAAEGYDLKALQKVRLHPSEPLSLSQHTKAQVFTQEDLARFNARIDPQRRSILERHGRTCEIQALLSAPVWVDEKLQAYLYLDNFERPDAFDELDLEMAHNFGIQLGLLLQKLELEARVTHLAYRDPLTGLLNRTSFSHKLAEALEALRHGRGRSLALLYLDLDGFKEINDLFGHEHGDLLLREVASRLQSAIRAGDRVARQGGDEFLLLLHDLADPADVIPVVERLLELLRRPLTLSGVSHRLSASVGIAMAHAQSTPQALLREADLALYQAKAQGRNRYAFFEASLQKSLEEDVRLCEALRQALEGDADADGQLTLHLQPIVSLHEGKLHHFEALLRWGKAPPSRFIPLAERRGLIRPLGRWVLQRAARLASAWGVPISVNISPSELTGDFARELEQVMREAAVAPGGLILEITEAAVLAEGAQPVLEQLRALGVPLHLDDFGSGYSSLEYLVRLPIDTLKLGQGFLRALGDPPELSSPADRVVRAVVSLGRSLELAVIAEGIESEAQLEYLKGLGVQMGQGYFLGRPAGENSAAARWGLGLHGKRREQ